MKFKRSEQKLIKWFLEINPSYRLSLAPWPKIGYSDGNVTKEIHIQEIKALYDKQKKEG